MARDTAAGLKERFDAETLEDVYMKTVAAGRRDLVEVEELEWDQGLGRSV